MFIQMRKLRDENLGAMPSRPEPDPGAWLAPLAASARSDGTRTISGGGTSGGTNAQVDRERPHAEAERRVAPQFGKRVASAWRILDHLDAQDELYKRKFTNNGPIGQVAELLPINPDAQRIDRYSELMLPLVKDAMGRSDDDGGDYGALLPRASRADADNADASRNLRTMARGVLKDAGVAYQPGSNKRPEIDFDSIRFNDQMPAEAPLPFKRLAADEEGDFQALAPHLSADEMIAWFDKRGIGITAESAKNVSNYYRGGGTQATGVNYGQSERDYQRALDAYNAKVDAVIGKDGHVDLFGNGVVLGSKPILNGIGGGVANTLNGGDFMSGYDFASDASRSRLAQTRAELGVPGMITEGAGMAVPSMVLPGSGVFNGSRIAAMTSPFARQMATDMAAGGIWGANNAAPGHGVQDAITGVFTAGLASPIGSSTVGASGAKLAGRALAPTGGSAAPLYAQGIRPTLGQRFGGEKGLLGLPGKLLNEVEQSLQQLPLFGHWVKGARDGARDQFETGGFNQALTEIGQALPDGVRHGDDAIAFGQTAFDDAYGSARSALTMRMDREAKQQIATLKAEIGEGALTQSAEKRFGSIVKKHVETRLRDGVAMSGKRYRQAAGDLRRIARARRRGANGDPMLADALDAYVSILDNAARRHSPVEAVAALDKVDTGYAQFARLENGGRTSGKKGSRFASADLDAPVLAISENFRSPAYLAGNRLLDDYADIGRRKLADTRTYADKAGEISLRGVGGGLASTLAMPKLTLGTIASYAPGVRDIVQGALAQAGPQRQAISEALQRRAHVGGGAVSPFAVQYTSLNNQN
jgi:hypothetical protein